MPRPVENIPWLRNESGSTAIEFAFLFPVWLWLTFETVQAGLYFYCSASLIWATDVAARQVSVGNVASAHLTADQFRTQIICPNLPGAMICNNIIVNMKNVPQSPPDFSSLVTAAGLASVPMDGSQTAYCPGQGGSIVALEVFYAMPVLGMPALGLSQGTTFNGQNVVFISATSAFMNEPFSAGGAVCY